jgi:hypothetical protein
MEWMAEVETEESLADPLVVDKWRKTITRGIPFYVLVPRGQKEATQKLAVDASLAFACIYEYTFVNDVCHVL